MSKQEEIREGIAQVIYQTLYGDDDWDSNSEEGKALYRTVANDVKHYLHSQGVVIKVKCPHCCWSQFKDEEPTGMTPCWHCDSTGYKFEPLIKEGE